MTERMRFIEGGTFLMGSDRHYPEEAPARRVAVDGFWIDETPVTNAEFAAFIAATGWTTFAETPPDPDLYPGIDPALVKPGSLVFTPTFGPVSFADPLQWWLYEIGASWRAPLGAGGPRAEDLPDHPVAHVAWSDVEAYAAWAGKALPTEAEWELAARGGIDGAEYAWGDELEPEGRVMANTWQGAFPWRNLKPEGLERTTPVKAFPPNGYGLFDMIGNVWEWTADFWSEGLRGEVKACCTPKNPRGGSLEGSYEAGALRIPRRVLKGGSHLCAPSYCRRYRPAARHPQPVDTSTSHVGFRCVKRAASSR
jgi:formylglycine-generating enzyme required for sulfatase activity